MNLAEIAYQSVCVDLLKGDHKTPEYLERNPQGLVPVLEIDGRSMTQSLAILEYLNDTRDMGIISSDPAMAAQERAIAHAIAVDIIPCVMCRSPPMPWNNLVGTKHVLNGCNGLLHPA